MFLILQSVLLIAFILNEPKAIAQPWPNRVAPVNKHTDAAKPLYSVQFITAFNFVDNYFMKEKFVIDIEAPFPWRDCIGNRPVPCENYQCTNVQTKYFYQSPSCHPINGGSKSPGSQHCNCPVNVVSPVDGTCSQALLNYDQFSLNGSDGRNPYTSVYYTNCNAGCAPSSTFESFPANVRGVMAFSRSPYAKPASVFYIPEWKDILALCLPSTLSSPGVMFFGDGPYYFIPKSNDDIRSLLSYTPLLKHPGSFAYFINVKAIVIKGRSINISSGRSTTKLSTIEPYTTLRSDIYTSVVRRFLKVTKRIPVAKPVAPFGLCYNISKNKTKPGLKVPDIHLILHGGSNWTISTANSIRQVTSDVACLAFIDGGAASEPPIVLGTFQFEDNFLVFDVHNSTLGFSSSLLFKGNSCANFNFTIPSNLYPEKLFI
uniref:chitinase CLP-like n=1 Tax=Erigeron canadensis TaxID=72917 RepID=UPI001CB9D6EE|nr:chitinase CLP-like [Erigeron canadensis]